MSIMLFERSKWTKPFFLDYHPTCLIEQEVDQPSEAPIRIGKLLWPMCHLFFDREFKELLFR